MFNTTRSLALAMAVIIVPGAAFAAAPKSYQVTGPVLELSETNITVQKGDEKWELARSADTKVTGDLKVGSKVTIHYFMTAKEVEVKEDKTAGAAKSAAASPVAAAASAAKSEAAPAPAVKAATAKKR